MTMSMPKAIGFSLLLAGVALTGKVSAQTLVHRWAFDEPLGFSTTFADSSGNGHTGTGSADIVAGRFGNAVDIFPQSVTGTVGDGIQWIDPTPGDSALPIGAADSWTLNLWTNFVNAPGPLEYAGGFGISSGEDVPTPDFNARKARSVISFNDAGNKAYHFWGSNVDVDSGMQFPADGQWHMSTITYNGVTTELSMYFDGVRVKSQIFGGAGPFLDAPAEVHAGNPSNWNEEFDGKIDELAIWDGVLSPAQIGGLFVNNNTQQPQNLQPTAVINRTTGHITLANLTPSDVINLKGYEITSAAGSLEPGVWFSVTGHLDQGQGTQPIDSGAWSVTTNTDVKLAEADQAAPGGTLRTGQTLDLGAVWTKSSYEDVVAKLFTDDGVTPKTIDLIVSYTGSSYGRSDLDANGQLDLNDWKIFATNGFTSLTGLSRTDAGLRGDLDGDGDNDRFDYRLFRADYIAAHGEAAFAAAMAAVPEPSTAVGLIVLASALVGHRRRR